MEYNIDQFDSRFLRARQFDVQGAYQQFSDTEKWRKEIGIDKLYDNVEVDEYEQARIVVSIGTPFCSLPQTTYLT